MATVTTDARRWWALGALVASMLTLGFDMTILNVALPTMAADLGATTGQQLGVPQAFSTGGGWRTRTSWCSPR